jgi:hypothetical protein
MSMELRTHLSASGWIVGNSEKAIAFATLNNKSACARGFERPRESVITKYR